MLLKERHMPYWDNWKIVRNQNLICHQELKKKTLVRKRNEFISPTKSFLLPTNEFAPIFWRPSSRFFKDFSFSTFFIFNGNRDRYSEKRIHLTCYSNHLKTPSSAFLITRYILRLGQAAQNEQRPRCPNRKMYLEIRRTDEWLSMTIFIKSTVVDLIKSTRNDCFTLTHTIKNW